LRQIAAAIQMYEKDNRSILPPWAINPGITSYPLGDFWANMLVRSKYISAPNLVDAAGQIQVPDRGQSAFRCPSGTDTRTTPGGVGGPSAWLGAPNTSRSGVNLGWYYQPVVAATGDPIPVDGTAVATWYTLNAYNGPNADSASTPFNWINGDANAVEAKLQDTRQQQRKAKQVKKGSEVVMAFDGLVVSSHLTNTGTLLNPRIAGRHKPFTGDLHGTANFAFFDGHVEPISTQQIYKMVLEYAPPVSARANARQFRRSPIFSLAMQDRER
jgi:prepilin-type processing-associated H-X9-DG protein